MPLSFLPERYKIVSAIPPQVSSNGTLTADNVSLKNVKTAYLVGFITTGHASASTLTVLKGTAVATAATALAFTPPLWAGAITTSTDALTRQTDAVSYATAATSGLYYIVIFQIDPTALGATYDCLGATWVATSALHVLSALWVLEMRQASDQPLTVITD